jgi:hypothetical protein
MTSPTVSTATRSGPMRWPATTKLLLAAFGWSALVLGAALVLGLRNGFDPALVVVGAAPMGLWLSATGWVAYGARIPSRAPNLVAIALCGACTLLATLSFLVPLLLAVYPVAVMIVVAAGLNVSRWPR